MEKEVTVVWDEVFDHVPAIRPELAQPLVLAYIGDAVFDLYVRQYLLTLGNYSPNRLHRQAAGYVSAQAQASHLAQWMPKLTEEEVNIVKRGRNAKSGTQPKHANIVEYRQSTGFEALIGYLFLKGQKERLKELLHEIIPPVQSDST